VRRFIWLAPVTLLALSLVAEGIGVENQQWEQLFFRANEAYKAGRFQEAVDGYSRLIQSGHESGPLFYNLGNAYFRLSRLGWAILNYERARLLMPRDADLNFNLRYARDQMKDAVAESQGLMNTAFFWLNTFNLHELFWGFAVLNVVFWAILVTRLFVRPDWIFYPLLVVLILWFIAGFSLGLKWYQVHTDERAVVVKEEISVLAGPDINDTVLFKLHAGTEVCLERSEEGWSLVSLPDKKRGWVKKEAVERINWTEKGANFSDVI
jgi:tetratricopeptide (TPR) repeat protein